MSSSTLIRWSGLAAVAGSALLVIFIDVVDAAGSQPDSVAMATSSWLIEQVSLLVATVLISLALVGLYARQVEEGGTLGLIAFLLAFTGTVMVAGIQWSEAFIAPWLASGVPDFVDPTFLDAEPSGVATVGFILTFTLFALGWLLFGLASLRARVLPRGATLLLMIGSVLTFFAPILELPGSSVAFGVALAWMGYALWSSGSEPALTAATT